MKAINLLASIIVVTVASIVLVTFTWHTIRERQNYNQALKEYNSIRANYEAAMKKCDYTSGKSNPSYCFERWEPTKPTPPELHLF